MATTTAHAETHSFQTEVQQLLHLMIHSLYSHKEIFLRELIANSSDACDKLRYEAIAKPELLAGDAEFKVRLLTDNVRNVLTIADNGIGLPEDRARLFEPYVTTRDEGTGLGLPIVKKIIEEHGGSLVLEDAPIFDGMSHRGAMAVIRLPALTPGNIVHKQTIVAGLT